MRFSALILIAFLFASCQSNSKKNTEIDKRVIKAMTTFIAQKKISGAVTLYANSDGVFHHAAIGMADIEKEKPMVKDSLFRIASLSKNFTCAALMTLQDDDKLNVNDKVEKYLPEFKGISLKKDDGKGPIDLRIWHLMSHTSGINFTKASTMPDLKTAASQMAKLKFNFRPGTQWKYSRGMAAVARIIEVVSGMSFEDYLKKTIYKPLELKDTGFSLNAEQAKRLVMTYEPGPNNTIVPSKVPRLSTAPGKDTKPVPSGGLISSVKDLKSFYCMLHNNGMHGNTQVLSKESVKLLMQSRTGEMKAGFIPGSAWALGFGLVKEPQGVTAMLNKGTFGHGGAYGTQAWVDPVTQSVYILLIQRTKFGNSDASDVRKEFQQAVVDSLK
jgi:CubicO group peptidase (beta-lactamase class C family)